MNKYYNFIKNNYKKLIVLWFTIFLISVLFTNKINEIVVYEVEIIPPNSMSKITIDKLIEEFTQKNYSMPFLSVLTGYNVYLILKNNEPFSFETKKLALEIEQIFKKEISNAEIVYVYSIIRNILKNITDNSTNKLKIFYNLTLILNKDIFLTKNNITLILNNYIKLEENLAKILNFLYYLPYLYIKCYNYTFEDNIKIRLEKARECLLSRVKIEDPVLELYFDEYYKKLYENLINKNFNITETTDNIIKTIAPKYLANLIDNSLLQIILLNTSIKNWQDQNILENIIFQFFEKNLNNTIIKNEEIIYYIKKIKNKEKNIDEVVYEIVLNYIKENFHFENIYNINIDKIVYDLIRLNTTNEIIILDYFANLIYKEIEETYSNPLFSFTENFKDFLKEIINTNDPNLVVNEIITNKSIQEYPIKLKQRVVDSLVKDNIFIIILIFKKQPSDELINKINEIKNEIKTKYKQEIYITGIPAISNELKKASFITIQTVIPIALIIVFILVSLYFRSVITGLLSLLIFSITIIITYFLVYLIVGLIINHKLSYISPSILTVLILGLCSDYFVYMIRRYKIEREENKDKNTAIKEMCVWSSQGVFISSLAVMLSYLTLAFMNIPLFGDAALANAIGIGITLLINLTLLPSIVIILGDRIIWPLKTFNKKQDISLFIKIAKFNEKNKKKLASLLVFVTLIALYYVFHVQTVLDIPPLMPNSEVKEATTIVYSKFGSSINPIYILIETDEQILTNSTINPSVLDFAYSIVQKIKEVEEVTKIETIVAPFGDEIKDINSLLKNETYRETYLESIKRFIGKSNKNFLVLVTIDKQPFSIQAIETLKKIKEKINELNPKYQIYFGGVTQTSQDSKEVTDNATPLIISSLSLIIMLLLFIQLYSVLIPIRLILTISSGIIWALALLYIVYNMYLSLPLVNAVPLFLIVTMLGVGVDYDIFLVTKVKEEKIKGKEDEEAIRIALEKIGTAIVVLGLILSMTLLTLMIPDFPLINQIGFTVGLAVIFDSLIIILFFVPAIMLIAKKWNWWPSRYRRN
jgi:Predicted drug exporters of the RND superfamily